MASSMIRIRPLMCSGSIEHSKLEFTLTLKVRRDPHIVAQFKANSPPAPLPPPAPAPPASKGGMRSFFSSSPKKPVRTVQPQLTPAAPAVLEENLARYLKPDGTLARAFVSFKDIASRCDTRLFETSFPLIGQHLESGSKVISIEIGEIVLQFFRLPPLPGIPPNQLPQSLDDCHRGLRHVHWHKMTYFEGTLTQNGGDCSVRDVDVTSPARTNRKRRRGAGDNSVSLEQIWLPSMMSRKEPPLPSICEKQLQSKTFRIRVTESSPLPRRKRLRAVLTSTKAFTA